MLGAVKLRTQSKGISQLTACIGNTASADISIVGSFPVAASEKSIRSGCASSGTVFKCSRKVVDIRHADPISHIPHTAVMDQDRIPFCGNGNIISTAASYISYAGKPLPVINDGKLTGNIPFLHDFIQYLGMADSVGRLSCFIGRHHYGNRPGSRLGSRNPFIRIYASHITGRSFLRM